MKGVAGMDFDILAGRWAQMFSKARQWFRRPGRIDDELKEVRKRILIEYGESYAVKQLEATEDYFRTVRLTIGPKIEAKLTASLDGSESEPDVEELVDMILEEEFTGR